MGKAIRKALLAVGLLALMAGLLRHSGPVGEAVRQGVALCGRSVIPSLFPFFVLSSLLIACGASELLSALLSPLMRPLFGLSGTGAAALALGLCGGYPVGARTAAELVENGALSQEEGERLLAAYEDYCAKLTAYGETLFAETFAFYDTLTEEKPE